MSAFQRGTIMRGAIGAAVLAWTAVASLGCDAADAKVKLAAGSAAPAFSLPGSDGNTHSLADHVGKEAVVISWFPKAFTGG